MPNRRSLLSAGVATALVAGCGSPQERRPPGTHRIRYGHAHNQYGELSLPRRTPLGTVVVIHGGYWYSQYTLDLMRPISRALQKAGWAVWNIEYRGIGGGGGWPTTFTDVAAALDHVRELDVPQDDVRLLGHSAGGQLAVWAASRTSATPGGSSRVKPTRVVSLAGVLDLTRASRDGLGGGAADQLMGGPPQERPDRYRLADPTLLVPAVAPVACVRGREDDTVPLDQSTGYVTAARKAGGQATFDEVAGDHFTLIDPTHESWRTTYARLSAR